MRSCIPIPVVWAVFQNRTRCIWSSHWGVDAGIVLFFPITTKKMTNTQARKYNYIFPKETKYISTHVTLPQMFLNYPKNPYKIISLTSRKHLVHTLLSSTSCDLTEINSFQFNKCRLKKCPNDVVSSSIENNFCQGEGEMQDTENVTNIIKHLKTFLKWKCNLEIK